MMAKMDSTSTEPMKALNRYLKGDSGWPDKLQNNTFGPDYDLSSCQACSASSPFVLQTEHCGEVKVADHSLLSPSKHSEHFNILSLASKNLTFIIYPSLGEKNLRISDHHFNKLNFLFNSQLSCNDIRCMDIKRKENPKHLVFESLADALINAKFP